MALLRALVPDVVVSSETYDDPPGLAPLPEEEPLVARSVAKRRNEFVTVRYCARQALGELGGVSFGVLGDAQLVLAAVAAGIAAAIVGVAEGPVREDLLERVAG